MILTVTPNPAIDITYTMARLAHGESQRVATGRSRSGGKGINVARVAHQLGHSVTAVAPVGGPNGDEFERELESCGLPHKLLRVSGNTRRCIVLAETGSSTTTILNETGSPLPDSGWSNLLDLVRTTLPGASCLVGSGSLPPKTPTDFYANLVEIAHAARIPAIIDATGDALLLAARAGADMLKPNRDELAETSGLADPVSGAASLLDAGARAVLVSLGADGLFVMTARERTPVHARLSTALAGNPTGAGDAAVAAVATCLAEGQNDTESIVRRATTWSAAAVLAPMAGEVAGDLEKLSAAIVLSRTAPTR